MGEGMSVKDKVLFGKTDQETHRIAMRLAREQGQTLSDFVESCVREKALTLARDPVLRLARREDAINFESEIERLAKKANDERARAEGRGQ